jgi:hypothetical protein
VSGVRYIGLDKLDVGIRIDDLYRGGATALAGLIDPQRRLVVLGIRRSYPEHGRCRCEFAIIGLYEDRGHELLPQGCWRI